MSCRRSGKFAGRRQRRDDRETGRIARVQGAYYVVTGLWPLLSMGTFQAITGPKVDQWLVRMVGILAAVIGGALLRDGLSGSRGRTPDVGLAVAAAAGFTAIDVVYVARRRISPVYLLDALVELALVAAWLTRGRGARHRR